MHKGVSNSDKIKQTVVASIVTLFIVNITIRYTWNYDWNWAHHDAATLATMNPVYIILEQTAAYTIHSCAGGWTAC